ncbi:MAG TPA: hypothetical protein VK970_05350 [Candidatus Methylacidiphilales bacterium]|nr:hypothetical protein [Candidatus Methylacidiphilales bacterium]
MHPALQNPTADTAAVTDSLPAVVVATDSATTSPVPAEAGKENLLHKAVLKGLAAAWENRLPGTVLPLAMAALVCSYYIWPESGFLLEILSKWKQAGGLFFAFFATGFAGGVLSQAVKVAFTQGFKWKRHNSIDALFTFLLFGFNGIIVFYFYRWQADFFGHEAHWHIVARKVMFDQFVFSVLWSTPMQSTLFAWKECGFKWQRLRPQLTSAFVANNMVPMVIANWFFWIPMVSLVYSLPTPLQFPLFLIANALWSLILATVARTEPA